MLVQRVSSYPIQRKSSFITHFLIIQKFVHSCYLNTKFSDSNDHNISWLIKSLQFVLRIIKYKKSISVLKSTYVDSYPKWMTCCIKVLIKLVHVQIFIIFWNTALYTKRVTKERVRWYYVEGVMLSKGKYVSNFSVSFCLFRPSICFLINIISNVILFWKNGSISNTWLLSQFILATFNLMQ